MKYILILSLFLTTYCKAQNEDQKIESIKLSASVSSTNEKSK